MIEFTWNQNKAESNRKKHGISFAEAVTVFGDPLEATISDPDHSEGEYRFLSMGISERGRLLIVSYVEVIPNSIHIISARRAIKHEHKQYESHSGTR